MFSFKAQIARLQIYLHEAHSSNADSFYSKNIYISSCLTALPTSAGALASGGQQTDTSLCLYLAEELQCGT